jgi:hypothetical protein
MGVGNVIVHEETFYLGNMPWPKTNSDQIVMSQLLKDVSAVPPLREKAIDCVSVDLDCLEFAFQDFIAPSSPVHGHFGK